MTSQPSAPPILSTPDAHIFEDPSPALVPPASQPRPSDQDLDDVYEISRTAREIRAGGWQRVALQFPDAMLRDAPRVFERLERCLREESRVPVVDVAPSIDDDAAVERRRRSERDDIAQEPQLGARGRERLFILADTSYGACCVDEIAAEHVDADVVVHYGRSCLSPTARLPVIYVFTSRPLPLDPIVRSFEGTFSDKDTKVILMADITYSSHMGALLIQLGQLGYTNLFVPSIVHDPSSPLPNRTVPPSVSSGEENLTSYHLFHISDPPASLLLTLSSRLESMYIYPTNSEAPITALQAQTSRLLMRRYALLTSLSTCPIFGILINTLSVKNYLPVITRIQAQIAAAGKKSYTFVVGKINAAKVANFSEIGGWVVVGCWESSLIESRDFYRPIITPFELGLALKSDEERLWTGEWTGDFNSLIDEERKPITHEKGQEEEHEGDGEGGLDDEESAPPEYDLRTGRYVSHSRPMRSSAAASLPMPDRGKGSSSQAMIRRANGDLTQINGTASPGAEYLQSQRTWKGLGSDFEIKYGDEDQGTAVEEGRRGVARGYTVGEDSERR
ncbi:MAG: Diphthamide biosynthesis protein 2 [Claussenomyces sp. TS43310]|nr:MAG: Diphthamide biosynthesis protein 2 [Claussenomyces sp. TS43310]